MLFMADTTPFCTGTANIWKLVGQVLFIFKIVIPLLLIIFGMIDLGKAVVGSKDDDVKKAISHLAFRAVAAVVIFFIPTLVGFIFTIVDGFDAAKKQENWSICSACISNPYGDTCSVPASKAANGDFE